MLLSVQHFAKDTRTQNKKREHLHWAVSKSDIHHNNTLYVGALPTPFPSSSLLSATLLRNLFKTSSELSAALQQCISSFVHSLHTRQASWESITVSINEMTASIFEHMLLECASLRRTQLTFFLQCVERLLMSTRHQKHKHQLLWI